MGLDDFWDYIVDGFDYIIHFEWVGDLKDGIVETFSNLGEFSMYGLIMGICGILFLLFTKKYMLDAFLKYMKPGAGIVITILTFALTFVALYLIGSRMENS